jgi:hypothetical protein
MDGRNIWALRMLLVAFVVLLAWPGLAGAQSFPKLKPIPHNRRVATRALVAPGVPSPWTP